MNSNIVMNTKRVSSKRAIDSDMKKCAKCHAYKNSTDFMKQDKLMASCRECRLAYMKEKELKTGKKVCYTCNLEQNLSEYMSRDDNDNETRIYPNCKKCRVAWVLSQNRNQ